MRYANQRNIVIRKEPRTKDKIYFSINREDVEAAARVLNGTAFKLYLYLASNQDGYHLNLSQVAFENAYGVGHSSYYTAFKTLVDEGFLVDKGNENYEFWEVPKM